VVSPVAKVRCRHCKAVFPYRPSEDDSVDDIPYIEPAPPGLLRAIFTATDRSTPGDTCDEVRGRYSGVTNQRLGSRQVIVAHPLAPASERSKDRLIGGKPVPFTESRQFMAVVLIFLLLGIGYAGFVGLSMIVKYLDEVPRMKAANLKKRLDPKAGMAKKASSTTGKIQAPAPAPAPEPAPTITRATAPMPLRIDGVEVCVEDARVGKRDQIDKEERLVITVRITNLSPRNVKYRPWSEPANGLLLRELTPNMLRHALIGPPALDETVLKPGQAIYDYLVFEPTSPFFGLELDLPAWPVGRDQLQFLIPANFIQRAR
jgi:hypothetical protein